MTASAPPVSPVRPMTPADYEKGQPLSPGPGPRPTRDLIVGAVVGAAALWAVPRMLDALADQFTGRLWTREDGGEFETELEP
jgi:hypothetical protein